MEFALDEGAVDNRKDPVEACYRMGTFLEFTSQEEIPSYREGIGVGGGRNVSYIPHAHGINASEWRMQNKTRVSPYISLDGGGGNGRLVMLKKFSCKLLVISYVYEKKKFFVKSMT